MPKPDLAKLTKAEEKIIKNIVEERIKKVENRFPLLVTLLVTFGLVSTFYGFEKLIDEIDIFVNNPWILLVTGISILVVTGTIYRKLR